MGPECDAWKLAERASPVHPMMIFKTRNVVQIRIAYNTAEPLPDPPPTALPPADQTLQGFIEHSTQAESIVSRNAYVDLTADILWTIERLVQALHIWYASYEGDGNDRMTVMAAMAAKCRN